jgi:hypothetical protein
MVPWKRSGPARDLPSIHASCLVGDLRWSFLPAEAAAGVPGSPRPLSLVSSSQAGSLGEVTPDTRQHAAQRNADGEQGRLAGRHRAGTVGRERNTPALSWSTRPWPRPTRWRPGGWRTWWTGRCAGARGGRWSGFPTGGRSAGGWLDRGAAFRAVRADATNGVMLRGASRLVRRVTSLGVEAAYCMASEPKEAFDASPVRGPCFGSAPVDGQLAALGPSRRARGTGRPRLSGDRRPRPRDHPELPDARQLQPGHGAELPGSAAGLRAQRSVPPPADQVRRLRALLAANARLPQAASRLSRLLVRAR